MFSMIYLKSRKFLLLRCDDVMSDVIYLQKGILNNYKKEGSGLRFG